MLFGLAACPADTGDDAGPGARPKPAFGAAADPRAPALPTLPAAEEPALPPRRSRRHRRLLPRRLGRERQRWHCEACANQCAGDGFCSHGRHSQGILVEGTPRCLRSWCNPRDQDGVKPSISAGTRLLRAVLRLSRAKFSLMNQPDWTAFVLLDMTPRAMAQQARLVATRLRDPEGVSC